MQFNGQKILPAVRDIKDFEKLIESDLQYIILLDIHVGQLKNLMRLAQNNNKKIILHADMVHGLKNDEYAAEFLCQEIKPYGIISTRSNVMLTVKKNNLLAIQRFFLLDIPALETGYKMVENFQPDYVEVLPGVIPHIIKEVKDTTGVPVLAGGLIRTEKDVKSAIEGGAEAVTTTVKGLWSLIE